MKYLITLNDKKYEVVVEKGDAYIANTTTISGSAPTNKPAQVNNSSEGEVIKAPIPGSVLDIKVNSGDRVKKGQIVLILEAMKMENEIVAPRDGVVKQIYVSKGKSVSTGDVLVALA